MNITFEKYRIRTYDSSNLIIEEFSTFTAEQDTLRMKKGDVSKKWKQLGFFPNVNYAFKFLSNKILLNEDSDDLKTLILKVEALESKIMSCKF